MSPATLGGMHTPDEVTRAAAVRFVREARRSEVRIGVDRLDDLVAVLAGAAVPGRGRGVLTLGEAVADVMGYVDPVAGSGTEAALGRLRDAVLGWRDPDMEPRGFH